MDTNTTVAGRNGTDVAANAGKQPKAQRPHGAKKKLEPSPRKSAAAKTLTDPSKAKSVRPGSKTHKSSQPAETPRRRDDEGSDEDHRLAPAFGARLSVRHDQKENGADDHLYQERRGTCRYSINSQNCCCDRCAGTLRALTD
jgi:hypothetical protein